MSHQNQLPKPPPEGWAKSLKIGDPVVFAVRQGYSETSYRYAYRATQVTRVGAKRFCIEIQDLWFDRETGLAVDRAFRNRTVYPATDANLELVAKYRKEQEERHRALEAEKEEQKKERTERATKASEWLAGVSLARGITETLSEQVLNDVFDELAAKGKL